MSAVQGREGGSVRGGEAIAREVGCHVLPQGSRAVHLINIQTKIFAIEEEAGSWKGNIGGCQENLRRNDCMAWDFAGMGRMI